MPRKKPTGERLEAARELLGLEDKPEMVRTGVYLEVELRDDLQAVAEKMGVSFNLLVRKLLRKGLDEIQR